jgi:hypothetical protein
MSFYVVNGPAPRGFARRRKQIPIVDLAEGKAVRLRARIEKFNLEGSILDRSALPYELIKPRARDDAAAIGGHVRAMRCARRSAIDGHAKTHRLAVR